MSNKMSFADRVVLTGSVLLAAVNLPATYAANGQGLSAALGACLEAVIWALAEQVIHSRWVAAFIAALS